MSLINNVLRELDRRNAAVNERAGVPREVRPLPADTKSTWRVPVAITVALGVIGSLALFWPAAQAPTPIVSVVQPPQPSVVRASPLPVTAAVPPEPTFQEALPAVKRSPTTGTITLTHPPATTVQPSAPVVAEKPASPPKGKVVYPHDPGLRLDASLTSQKVTDTVTDAADEFQRAQNLLKQGRSADAEPLLRQVLQMHPGNLAARQALLGILLPSRRFTEAAPVLREGLANNPEQLPWAMNLARLQAETNDYPGAWETLNRSISHAQQNPEYLAFAGTVLQRMNRYAEALAHYEAALRLRPQEARWWVGYGIALESAGRGRDAGEAFSRARNLGGLSPEIEGYLDQKLK